MAIFHIILFSTSIFTLYNFPWKVKLSKSKILKNFMNTKQCSFVVIFVEGGDLKTNGEMLYKLLYGCL
jgi:hypothetical protein